MNSLLQVLLHKSEDHPRPLELVTFLNPYSYLVARDSVSLFSVFDRIYFDGIILARAMSLLGINAHRRSFDMTSIAPDVLGRAEKEQSTVYFIGSEPGIADRAVSKLTLSFPHLRVAGTRNGFFRDASARDKAIADIVRAMPNIVIVGMGTPRQEQFLVDLRDHGWRGSGYTCGGFLHQTARSGIRYYPIWVDHLNLRWLYRMIDEPKLVWRYCFHYPRFLGVFAWDLLRYKLEKH